MADGHAHDHDGHDHPGHDHTGAADAAPAGHVHIHDPEGHVEAVETDFEYFRRKRLESRVLHFLRRGIITFADLLRADPGPGDGTPWRERRWADADGPIRFVEDELDRLVKGIATATVRHVGAQAIAIDDTRRERGDYDPFFRIAEREHLGQGYLDERLETVAAELADAHRLLAAFTQALLDRGRITTEQLAARREELARIDHRNGARITARAWLDPSSSSG